MKSFPLLLFLPLFIAAVTSLTVFLIQSWHHQTSAINDPPATAADGCVTYQHDISKNLIEQEINAVMMMPTRVRENGCVACHILFTLVNRMGISEASASDQLSEILTHDQNLNEKFIDVVEKIHMKQRMMGVSFSLKSRDSKNRYINSQMKDGLYELNIDLVNYGKDIVMRKLLITYLSLQLAQTIGIDHHAAKEELYYYMRTKDNETHTMLTEFMDHFYEKVCKDEESGSDRVI